MSFVSLTDACRELGIDAKTLRHWLAQAQLPLHSHPSDGRKKGLSQPQLHELAAQHHRALPHACPALSVPPGNLSAELLALAEQLADMQGQLAALRAEVAALCQPLPSPPPPALVTEAPPSAPAPQAAPTAARKPVHVLARLEYASEGHYVVLSPTQGMVALQADSPAWFAWLSRQTAFRFVGRLGHFSARYDAQRGSRAWRAHRKIRNHTANLRLGPTNQVTAEVLEQAAAPFQALLK